MAPRSVWKGYLRLALIACPVKLYKATSEPEKVSFAQINRRTMNKIKQERVDSETGDLVESADVAKGVQVAEGKYVEVTDDEIAAAAPPSIDEIEISSFCRQDDISAAHIEDHYFLGPDGEAAAGAFALLRAAIAHQDVAAIATVTMGTRERLVAIRPCDKGMIVTLLRDAGEIRDPTECFAKVSHVLLDADLLELTTRIVTRRIAVFDASRHQDRYQAALAELVRSKIAGRMLKPATAARPPRMVDLREAVRKSAAAEPSRGKRKIA
jgi:DNA end-binding protein Ku